MKHYNCDVVVVGAGPAGLAAAVSAKKNGAEHVIVIERENRMGGILKQCIHAGFGLQYFGEELTGPEYAEKFMALTKEAGIEVLLNTTAVEIKDKTLICVNTEGVANIQFGALVLAMGCRERTRANLMIPGSRPSGIYTAGTAQRLVNMEGYLPGRKCVILGSGDIGLIMARRMTLEGAEVKVVAELMPYSGGLKRNIVQCLDDYGIPLKLSHTVVDIKGRERVEAIVIAEVDEKLRPIPGTEIEYECDTLLLSCGLLPENELSRAAGVDINPLTNGPRVNEQLETNVPGVFAAGNVLHVHDLVDFVSEEASAAGRHAAAYIQGAAEVGGKELPIKTEGGVRYTVPVKIRPEALDPEGKVTIRFRVGAVYQNKRIVIYAGDKQIFTKKRNVLAPGEMETVNLKSKLLLDCPEANDITVTLEDA